MMMELNRVALYSGAACGDVETIERFFRQPSTQLDMEHVNSVSRTAYEAALACNADPFLPLPQSRRTPGLVRRVRQLYEPFNISLFTDPAKNIHMQVFAWFCGNTATQLIGDAMRRLLRYLYSQVASYSTYCAEITEVVLESPLFKTLAIEGRAHALAMMIKAATSMKRVDTIRLLIAHGVRVDDDTVMQLALKQADAAAVQVLAESGVSWLMYPHITSDFCGHSTAAWLLVSYGLDIQVKGDENSSVHIAALYRNVETLRVWPEEGYADVNVQCYGEKTPLIFAVTDCRYGNEEVRLQIIQTLLEYGADVHFRDFSGATVMYHALVLQDEAVVEMLIKAGADLFARDKQNHTPYDQLMVTDSVRVFVNAHHPQYFHPL